MSLIPSCHAPGKQPSGPPVHTGPVPRSAAGLHSYNNDVITAIQQTKEEADKITLILAKDLMIKIFTRLSCRATT